MEERMLRLWDSIQSHLQSGARSPAERDSDAFLARYPYQHDGESEYEFNRRINAYKTPEQILAEIDIRGAADFYCLYDRVETKSFPFGDTYTERVQEMRLLMRSRQLTEPVIVALIEHQVPLQQIYSALGEADRSVVYAKPISLAVARHGHQDSIKTLANLYLGGMRWNVHSEHFDQEVMITFLSRLQRPQFLELFEANMIGKGFAQLLEDCKQAIRSGLVDNRIAKAFVVEEDLGY